MALLYIVEVMRTQDASLETGLKESLEYNLERSDTKPVHKKASAILTGDRLSSAELSGERRCL